MASTLIRRNVTGLAEETLADTPITVISGARQVGKTTLMQQLVSDRDARVISLDDTVDREAAATDPDGFAAQYPSGLLAIDEIQRVPALLTALKASVDRDRRPGRFLVTGSADLLSLRGSQESLAGRAQTIALEGLSRDELSGRSADFASFLWSLPSAGTPADSPDHTRRDYLELVTTPMFPEIVASSPRQRDRWLANYTQRVLSKDSSDITGIQHPDRLEPLLSVIAARNAGEFVAARVARELDIPERSIPTYLRALESVFLVRSIPAWSKSIASSAISRPKVLVTDTGLAAYLAGVAPEGLEREISSNQTGGLVEGFVVNELAKQRVWSAKTTRMSHFRDRQGREVDIILEDRRRDIVGLEVKATSTPRSSDFTGLSYLRDLIGERFIAGVVLHTGTAARPFGDRLWALPLSTLWDH